MVSMAMAIGAVALRQHTVKYTHFAARLGLAQNNTQANMSRIPPASMRLSSGTLNYVFIGTSHYFFINQLKQNLALQHTFRLSQHLFYNYARITKKKRKPVVHPCVLPIYTQLRAKKYFNLQFNQSQSWFLEKAQSGAVGLVLSRCLVTLSNFVALPLTTLNPGLNPKPCALATHNATTTLGLDLHNGAKQRAQPQPGPHDGQSAKPKSWAKHGLDLGRFKLNAFDGMKSLALASDTVCSKTRFRTRTRGNQTYANLSNYFGCLKKTNVLSSSSAYVAMMNHGLLKSSKTKKSWANRLQYQASLNAMACVNNQRQAYGGMANDVKHHESVRFLQHQLQTWFKSGHGKLTQHAYAMVNPGHKSRAVDFMLFCIVQLVGAKPKVGTKQNAFSKLNPNGLIKHSVVKKPARYSCFSLNQLSQTQGARLANASTERQAQLTALAGLSTAYYDHNAQSRDEKAHKGSTSRGFLYDANQGMDGYALKMNVLPSVNPKLSVARTFLNPAQCHLFTFLEGRFAKCVKQDLQRHKNSAFKQGFKPKPASGAAKKLQNTLKRNHHYHKTQALGCPSFGALRSSYGSKTKIGLARSKTSVVFNCRFHGHNKSPALRLRPSLSIRL